MGALEDEEKRRSGEEATDADEEQIPDSTSTLPHTPVLSRSTRNRRLLAAGLIGIGLLIGLPPLLTWQRTGEERARSLSNMRRLADAWQLYAQDWDGFPVPSVERRAEDIQTQPYWLTWNKRLGAYGAIPSILDNPANPAGEHKPTVHDPFRGFTVSTSYALNTRFWNTFAPGPFPVDNLELPAQTALFVEAGPMSTDPLRPPRDAEESRGLARLEYGDVADRVEGLWPYPSTHGGKIAVVAADGHAVSLSVEHYTPASAGPHNPVYGRIGGDIYNWNGGHLNGEVDHPPVE